MVFSVYVLRNPGGRLYVGSTSDLQKRVRQHQEGEGGWTRGRGPWTLVYYEKFDQRSEAIKRERSLKRGRANQQLRRRLEDEAVGC